MSQSLDDVLSNLPIFTDERDYVMVKLPPRAVTLGAGIVAETGEPFSALVVDKDELTIVMPADLVVEFGNRIPDGAVSDTIYRLITFDIELDSSLVGFMASVSRALAQAEIPIMSYAAFSRDHLLVPADQLPQAIIALENMQQ